HLGPHHVDDLDRRCRRPAGGEHVVDEQDAVVATNGVGVHLEAFRSVFELVVDPVHVVGKLALLSRRDEPRVQTVGNRRRHDEPAGFDTEDASDTVADEPVDDRVDHRREPDLVAEQRRDVLEDNARCGEVRDIPDEGAQTLFVQDCAASAARFASSSGGTSSTCVAIHHWLPAVSCTPALRSPKNWFAGSRSDDAPSDNALAYTASTSST